MIEAKPPIIFRDEEIERLKNEIKLIEKDENKKAELEELKKKLERYLAGQKRHRELMEENKPIIEAQKKALAELERFETIKIPQPPMSVMEMVGDSKYGKYFSNSAEYFPKDTGSDAFRKEAKVGDINIKLGLFGKGLTFSQQRGVYLTEGEELEKALATEAGDKLREDTLDEVFGETKSKILEGFPNDSKYPTLQEVVWFLIYLKESNMNELEIFKGKNIRIPDSGLLPYTFCVEYTNEDKIKINIENKKKTYLGLLIKA